MARKDVKKKVKTLKIHSNIWNLSISWTMIKKRIAEKGEWRNRSKIIFMLSSRFKTQLKTLKSRYEEKQKDLHMTECEKLPTIKINSSKKNCKQSFINLNEWCTYFAYDAYSLIAIYSKDIFLLHRFRYKNEAHFSMQA